MIYIDLDDVAADYTGYVNRVLGTNYQVGDLKSAHHWKELCHNHQHMFMDLEPNQEFIPILHKIVGQVGESNVAFLTALPYDEQYMWQYAPYHKVQWVLNYLAPMGYSIPVFFGPFAHDKYRHYNDGDILIDDQHQNCEQWISAGGTAHVYTNAANCHSFLLEHLSTI